MKKFLMGFILFILSFSLFAQNQTKMEQSARGVLKRVVGEKVSLFVLQEKDFGADSNDHYIVDCDGMRVRVFGNSVVALVRGAYDYLRNSSNSIVTWSGKAIRLNLPLKKYQNEVESPYPHRFYFNVVTHGYTTAYWDWNRWEEEFDWMALHGINLVLMGGAHEAILYRIWKQLGLTDEEALDYFTGPAYFPWNRMGNITGWSGPLPLSYFDKQVALAHQQLDRMRELGIEPIIHSFAGFVPEAILRLDPSLKVRTLSWGGFFDSYRARILPPDHPLFVKIGKMYLQEWEKEFGPANFYLADSFNEMDVPVFGSPKEQAKQLAGFGRAVYRPIVEVNPNAVWVMQGWTFPFHKQNGVRFWTPKRLAALFSDIPDDKLMILDMANEFYPYRWKIEPSWKKYEGFFGKQWIYSFIINMGGKVDYTGMTKYYATASIDALNYEKKGNLVGFGTSPEGIESNELVYELVYDMGWRDSEIDLTRWFEDYYRSRYGRLPEKMKEAVSLLSESIYSSFASHPRRSFQYRTALTFLAKAHRSPEFLKAVECFLACADELKDEPLYRIDAMELSAFYLSCLAEDQVVRMKYKVGKSKRKELETLTETLLRVDTLLENHPLHRLERCIDFARAWGDNKAEKNYYEKDVRRLITTWGGQHNEYAAKIWSGLIRDYYAPRHNFINSSPLPTHSKVLEWEENWVQSVGVSEAKKVVDPLESAVDWVTGATVKKNRR